MKTKSAKSIYFEAVENHAREKWSEFLELACEGDDALRRNVERLLEARKEIDGFMLQPAAQGIENIANSECYETLGTMIGQYKLLEPIGEGGMGTVYMAEQSEPVHRKVALKLIKPGMDTKQVIARFEAERQALAMMDHPSISKVFDAGATESGRPYFVMELVQGTPITKFCDTHQLAPRQRLELFQQVCHGVQHAHQKGIIHRDLKPSNVMVSMYDGRPVSKVIDFGVAKATGEQLTEKTFFTRFGQMVGTLECMSPEQAQLNQTDVDTRSDIYSLGVILYELLTGEPPFEKERIKNAALDETLKMIREEEPTKPSTKISSLANLPEIASMRQTQPQRLSGIVRGELDWIVMKALEKDRARRYETANGFAQDIERFLNDEPVSAGPPSAAYRFRKYARRNKVAMTIASLILMGLIVGVVGLSISNQMISAEKKLAIDAKQIEAEQRARAQHNYRMALGTLGEMVSNAAQHERMIDIEGWRRQTLEKAIGYYSNFAEENAGDAESVNELLQVQNQLAKTYLLLEDYENAERAATAGIDLAEGSSQSSITGFDSIVVGTLWARQAKARQELGRTDQAAQAWVQANRYFAEVLNHKTKPSGKLLMDVAEFLRSYANWSLDFGSPVTAGQTLLHASDVCRLATDAEPGNETARVLQCQIKHDLGDFFQRGMNRESAIVNYSDALELAKGLSETRENRHLLAKCQGSLGMQYLTEHKFVKKAESQFRDAALIYQKLVEDYPWDVFNHGDLAACQHNLALALTGQGNTDEALELLAQAQSNQSFTIRHKSQNSQYQLFWAKHKITQANIARDTKNWDQAKDLYLKSIEHLEQLVKQWPDHRKIQIKKAEAHLLYGLLLRRLPGAFANPTILGQAEEHALTALETFQNLEAQSPEVKSSMTKLPELDFCSHHLHNTYTQLAGIYAAWKRYDKAIDAIKQAKSYFDRAPGLQSPIASFELGDTEVDLAAILFQNDGDRAIVESIVREGLQRMQKAYSEDPDVVKTAIDFAEEVQFGVVVLALALYEQNKYTDSKNEWERAINLATFWPEALQLYAEKLVFCPDESFRDYLRAIELGEDILLRAEKSDTELLHRTQRDIGIAYYRLQNYREAKRVFSDIMIKGQFTLLYGYHFALTLAKIDPDDDDVGPFRKKDAKGTFYLTEDRRKRFKKMDFDSVSQLARNELIKILKIDGDSEFEILVDQAQALQTAKQYSPATEYWQQVVDQQPDYAHGWLALGDCLFHAGEYDRSIEVLKRAVEFEEKAATAYWNLGAAFSIQNQPDEAFDALSLAIELGYGTIDDFRNSKNLKTLHVDGRFEQLLQRLQERKK